jgi:hypothetical protein
MFGFLMLVGQSRAAPWDGTNAGLMQRRTTGPHHIQWPWRRLLSVQGRERHRVKPGRRSTWSRPHSGRAAARTTRNGFAPMRRCLGRHGSCPTPAHALASRLAIATAQRALSSCTLSGALQASTVGQKASMAGGGFLCPGRLGARVPARLRSTPRTRRPGHTACSRPPQAWLSASAVLG